MTRNENTQKGKIVYFSHGGGPLPLLGDPSHDKMVEFMKTLPSCLDRPEAIVVFSAHWEEEVVNVQSGAYPEILYDYYGFPDEAYQITYLCSGNEELAKRIGDLLEESGMQVRLDEHRPYDHGAYIPLKLMYPQADIPVIQVSLNHNLDPLTHLEIGEALKPLLEENVLFIGSGFSFHNMSRFSFGGSNTEDPRNDAFQEALIDLCCREKDQDRLWKRFVEWESLPEARYCHPREEHLLPLHVCVGLSRGRARKVFDDYIVGKRATAFLWE